MIRISYTSICKKSYPHSHVNETCMMMNSWNSLKYYNFPLNRKNIYKVCWRIALGTAQAGPYIFILDSYSHNVDRLDPLGTTEIWMIVLWSRYALFGLIWQFLRQLEEFWGTLITIMLFAACFTLSAFSSSCTCVKFGIFTVLPNCYPTATVRHQMRQWKSIFWRRHKWK